MEPFLFIKIVAWCATIITGFFIGLVLIDVLLNLTSGKYSGRLTGKFWWFVVIFVVAIATLFSLK
jgi:hypothetical protein